MRYRRRGVVASRGCAARRTAAPRCRPTFSRSAAGGHLLSDHPPIASPPSSSSNAGWLGRRHRVVRRFEPNRIAASYGSARGRCVCSWLRGRRPVAFRHQPSPCRRASALEPDAGPRPAWASTCDVPEFRRHKAPRDSRVPRQRDQRAWLPQMSRPSRTTTSRRVYRTARQRLGDGSSCSSTLPVGFRESGWSPTTLPAGTAWQGGASDETVLTGRRPAFPS